MNKLKEILKLGIVTGQSANSIDHLLASQQSILANGDGDIRRARESIMNALENTLSNVYNNNGVHSISKKSTFLRAMYLFKKGQGKILKKIYDKNVGYKSRSQNRVDSSNRGNCISHRK